MRILLIYISVVFFSGLFSTVFGQSCPTFSSRNNGNGGGNCAAADANNKGVYLNKTGHFTFATTTSYTVTDIYLNNTLIQQGNSVLSGSIYFGEMNAGARDADLCFYAVGNSNVPPAGQFKFILVNGNTTLTCSYLLTSGNSNSTSSVSPGTIGSDQTICSGLSPNTLTSVSDASSGTTYKWQQSTTSASSGFTDISGATSSTYTPGNLNQTTYFQRIAVSGADQFASNVITVTVASSLSWTGTTNTTFATSSNWNPAISPSGCNVTIPGSSSVIPQLGADISVRDLTIESSKSIDLSSKNLTLTGNFTNDGTVSGTGGLVFAGSSSQTISGVGTVKNINVNNSSGIVISSGSNKLNILGVLSVSAGSGSITTNDNLVLKATSSEEGIIGTISTCPIDPFNGDVIVERYIPATARSLRFISPGVYSSSVTIKQNWQEGVNETNKTNYGVNAINPQNPNPGYGTHISGSTTGLNGLDATITGNPSMYWFENKATNYGWQTITNTDTTRFRRPGQAFAIMIRGDRSIDMTSNTPQHTSTILRTKGKLTNCSYTFTSDVTSLVPLSAAADGYSFIGNPFWSIVNWSRVGRTNVDNKIYYFDPAISGTNSVGGYVALTMVDENNEANDQKSINSNGRLSRYLQPGQGFFVRNSNSGNAPQIAFEEADKENTAANKFNIFSKNPSGTISEHGEIESTKVAADSKFENIHVSLYLKKNLNIAPADGFLISYNSNFSDALGIEDANKLSNQDENMFALFKGSRYSILGLESSSSIKSDTIPVSLTNLYDQDYIMRLDFSNDIDPRREIFLINKVTGTKQKLDLTKSFDYEFRPQSGVKSVLDYAIVINSGKIESMPIVAKSLVVVNNPVVNGVLKFALPVSETQTNLSINKSQVYLLDLSGRVLVSKSILNSNNVYESLNIEKLSNGVYILKVNSNGETFTKKIIKQ